MVAVETKPAEDQLDTLLEELGVETSSTEKEGREYAIDQLLDEMLQTSEPRVPAPATPSLPNIEEKKSRLPSATWIISALLFGCILGTPLGFYLARPQKEISQLVEQISDIQNRLKLTPFNEMIEPTELPSEFELLAPSEIT